ncbi:MAG: MerR family transcriptional regulator [Clostridia bacterium]|nr:MerR family transcriptional regulator [Clostridia bacterium]
MYYTVGEMAKRLGVAPSTLRYYDQEGLLPFVERSEGGIRVFKESDYEWLQVISCLKKTGMQLRDIKTFIEMAMQGDQTIEPRLALITKQKESVKAQIAELEETLRTLEFKEWYYNTAKENGTTSVPRNMTLDELPEEFREVRLNLRGE